MPLIHAARSARKLSMEEILDRFKKVKKKKGGGWMACCSSHRDRTPSLSIDIGDDGKILFFCFSGCTNKEICAAAGLTESDLFPDSASGEVIAFPGNEVSLANLATMAGVTVEHLAELGLAESRGEVLVPYFDRKGEQVYVKRRVAMTGSKYRIPSGSDPMPYGLWRYPEGEQTKGLVLVEGESDCWSLWAMGVPALGIPGANTTSCLDPDLLEALGVEKVYVVQEAGKGGQVFVQGIADRLEDLDIEKFVVEMPSGTDDPADSARQLGLDEAYRRFKKLCAKARELGDPGIDDLLITLADVEPREVEWLWHPYIPLGYPTICAGRPGIGKSYFTSWLSASIAAGGRIPMPGETPEQSAARKPATVILFSAEDSIDQVIWKRCDESGATRDDKTRIKVFDLQKHGFSFQDSSFALLEMMIEKTGAKAVIFDPFISFVDGKLDMNRQNEVRAVFNPLIGIAQKTSCAIFTVAHLKKGSPENLMDGIVGSVDFSAAVRSGLIIHDHPGKPSEQTLIHAKSNLSEEGKTLTYSLRGGFQWTGALDMRAEEVAAALGSFRDRPQAEAARAILIEELSYGSRPVSEIKKVMKLHGISDSTYSRIVQELGIQRYKQGWGEQGVWFLKRIRPEEDQEAPF